MPRFDRFIHPASRNFLRSFKSAYVVPANQGFTMPEISAVIAVVGALVAITAPNINIGTNPLEDSAQRVAANLKLTRVAAISHTSAYRIRTQPATTKLVIERAPTCTSPAAQWSRYPGFADEDLVLDDQVQITSATENGTAVGSTAWSICFNSRGMADKNLALTFTKGSAQRQIEVFPGGTVDS